MAAPRVRATHRLSGAQNIVLSFADVAGVGWLTSHECFDSVWFGFQTRSNSFRSVVKRGEVNSLRRLQAWHSPAVPKPIVPRLKRALS
jgi:hypothetical protein